MFNFFKKKEVKEITISCNTDVVFINKTPISFPVKYNDLVTALGEPNREITSSNTYLFWDDYGIFCSYTDKNEIISITIFQNKLDKSEYNTKKQFTGTLLLNDEDITNNEFHKIPLGKIAIHRLGRENETRFGFNIGINKVY